MFDADNGLGASSPTPVHPRGMDEAQSERSVEEFNADLSLPGNFRTERRGQDSQSIGTKPVSVKPEPFLVSLNKELAILDLPDSMSAEISQVLSAPRGELQNQLIAKLLVNSPLLKGPDAEETPRPDKRDSARASMTEYATRVGTAFFVCKLVEKDPGLAEKLNDLYSGSEVDPDELRRRLDAFWGREKHKSLLVGHDLMVRESNGQNSVLVTNFTAGLLKPCFELNTRGQYSMLDFFYSGEPKFIDLNPYDWMRRDKKLIENILMPVPTERPSDIVTGVGPHPTLTFILRNLTNKVDILNGLLDFVRKVDSLSVVDLNLLAQAMPGGVNEGENNKCSDLFDHGGPEQRAEFRTTDLAIMLVALKKTTNPEGKELLGAVGQNMRDIIKRSVTYRSPNLSYHYDNEKAQFRSALMDFYVSEFSKVVDRVLVEPKCH